MNREPYIPGDGDWSECLEMLCEMCAHWPACALVDRMIDSMNGDDEWPEGGFVTDAGAEVTCLTYSPRGARPLASDALSEAIAGACDMCDGCAARKGSEASVSLHTQRDFRAAVNDGFLFTCHKPENRGRACGGWAKAVKPTQAAGGRV
jgi:hypothetical protein